MRYRIAPYILLWLSKAKSKLTLNTESIVNINPVCSQQFLAWHNQTNSTLTSEREKDKNLCMKGKIQTQQKCPKCKGKFKEAIVNNQKDLWCPQCLTHPTRYFVDIYWKTRHRIFADQDGRILNNYELTYRLLTEIRQKIDKKSFDPKEYVSSSIKPLRFSININTWLKKQKRRLDIGEIAPSYYEKIESISRKYFIPYFEDKDVREIRTANIEDFRMSLPIELSLKTQKNIIDLLQKYFNDLYDREEIKKKPKFPKINIPDPHWNWVDVDEQELIFSHIQEKHKAIFAFMMLHGCRPGEARAIWREDLDFKNGTCLIRRSFSNDVYRATTKTQRQRLIPLHPDIIPMLKEIPVIKGFFFIDPDTENPYKKRKIETVFNSAKRLAGIEDIKLYEWSKHSYNSQAVNRGVNPKLSGEMTGVTSWTAQRRYQHINIDGFKLTLRPQCKILNINYGSRTTVDKK